MAEWHTFQVSPNDEWNPFRATIISPPAETDFENGYIRIIPPVDIGEALLESVGVEGDHDLDFWAGSKAKGAAATVISFDQKENELYEGALIGRDRIARTTRALLNGLRYLADDNTPKEES